MQKKEQRTMPNVEKRGYSKEALPKKWFSSVRKGFSTSTIENLVIWFRGQNVKTTCSIKWQQKEFWSLYTHSIFTKICCPTVRCSVVPYVWSLWQGWESSPSIRQTQFCYSISTATIGISISQEWSKENESLGHTVGVCERSS